MKTIVWGLLLSCLCAWAQWVPQRSGTEASLRGLSAVSESVAWASGSGGTVLRTTDGGGTWHTLPIPGTGSLDFRAIQAFDAETAFVMSAGPGHAWFATGGLGGARVYRLSDWGRTWSVAETLVRHDTAAGGIFSIAFRGAPTR